MTPQRIADISDPIEQLYSDMTDELLLNIAKHLNSSTWTWTALHEIETLEQMGQLTEENTKIINKYVRKIPQAVKDAMNDSRLEALSEIEEKLAQAALNGYLVAPVTDSTVSVMEAFSQQALSQLNLVNQTMLNSSLAAYQTGLYTMRQGMTTITDADELDEAQQIIDIAAGKTALGSETRTGALRKALRQLNYNGITGFYDRIGRSWSAEAYVNMDIRTTVHNTYIQSVKSRQEDYGSDVFQVSSHAGARPLCYPYQGKLYSWGNSGGYITLGDGKRYKFGSINETSYGKPAGLFGINCGHVPYPMIAGVSERVDEKIQPKAENDKEYQESQQQRSLERAIRYQKRELAMLGDNATQLDKDRLRRAQANMRAFIKQTGRTRRYDREQIVTDTPAGKPIKVADEAIRQYTKGTISEKAKAEFDAGINKVAKDFDIDIKVVKPMNSTESKARNNAPAVSHTPIGVTEYNPTYFAKDQTIIDATREITKAKGWVRVAEKDYMKYTAVHEASHYIFDVERNIPANRNAENLTREQQIAVEVEKYYNKYYETAKALEKRAEELKKIADLTGDENDRKSYREARKEYKDYIISEYSLDNPDDMIAESGTDYYIGSSPNEKSLTLINYLKKYVGRQ